jgi:hypothetical protein
MFAAGHGGANEGYRAMFFAFADRGQSAIIMTSGDAGSPLIGELLRAVAEEYGWPAQRSQMRENSIRYPAARGPGTRCQKRPALS